MNTKVGALIFLCTVCNTVHAECSLQWSDDLFKTDIIGPKGAYGDTNTAYAVFNFKSDPGTVYRISGEFPHVRYMGVDTSKRLDNLGIGTWDVDSLQDHEIIPDKGSENPFHPGVPKDVTPRSYTVYAVPEGASYPAENRVDIATDTSGGSIWLRMVAPNFGYTIENPAVQDVYKLLSLPKIEALDLNGNVKACDQVVSAAAIPSDIPSSEQAQVALPNVDDVAGLLEPLLQAAIPEKFWTFRFLNTPIPFEGNSAIPGYLFGLTKLSIGNVALIKVKAPSFTNTFPDSYTIFNPVEDVRYWSMCALDLNIGDSFACFADYQLNISKDGYVTIAYGRAGDTQVSAKAKSKGYNFLPDTREAAQKDDILAFVFRQILPSASFSENGFNTGNYVPKARICRRSSFLAGLCSL